MTYEEMTRRFKTAKPKRKPDDEEHRIQCACIKWFRYAFPDLRKLLFAVPNGSRRDAVTGARLKEEGVTAGVADLLLLVPNKFYGMLAIEMKTPKGRQSDTQKEWQGEVERMGNKYVVCRSLDDFMDAIVSYLKDR